MRLGSLFTSLRWRTVPEQSPSHGQLSQAPSATTRPTPQARMERGLEKPLTALPTGWDDFGGQSGRNSISKTQPDRLSHSRPKSPRKGRRSWFGRELPPEQDAPETPEAVSRVDWQKSHTCTEKPTRRKSRLILDLTEESSTHESGGKSKASNLFRANSKSSRTCEDFNDAASSKSGRSSLRKKVSFSRPISWFSKHADEDTVEALPPLPPMPVEFNPSTKPEISRVPVNKRSSKSSVSVKSVPGSISQRRSRSSFWASSNPDDSNEIPPVPSLAQDGHELRKSESKKSVDSIGYARTADFTQPAVRQDVKRQSQCPRPVSTASRRSYVPKSAAKGFLQSTNGASDEVRQSYRISFRLDENADLVCLTEEQRIGWAKLMNESQKYEERPRTARTMTQTETVSATSSKKKYSNAQALAALEFGLR